MDAFRTLTGGSKFDRKRFAGDMNHFQESRPKQQPVASTSTAVPLPSELDFFAQPAPSSSSSSVSVARKRKRAPETDATLESVQTTEMEPHDYAALLRKHKIKLTGLDLPEPVASVQDLVQRAKAQLLASASATTTGTEEQQAAALDRLARNWRALGYKDPTGVQMAAWGTMLAGRDILACAPTGSGKTYSFILPLLALLPPSSPSSSSSSPLSSSDKVIRPRAVVIEPTRELSIQVLREARKLAAAHPDADGDEPAWKIAVLGEEGVGVAVASARSQKRKNKKKQQQQQQQQEGGGQEGKGGDDSDVQVKAGDAEEDNAEQPYYGPVDILITTPLRLVFALKSNLVSLGEETRHLILDEADKLFELNFLEQTDEILAACRRRSEGEGKEQGQGLGQVEVRKGMFSATMPSTVEELAKGVMAGAGSGMVRAIVGHKEAATTTIDQKLLFVNREDHKLLSLRSLITSGEFTPPVLIFVQSIQRAKELANELVFDGINADAIHADRSASERDDVVRKFAEGKVWCLICTDVMARGVDFKGVKLVINYDFPQSAMSYIHRIGRTGRAGKAGRAITFFSKADAGHLKTIVNVMRASGCSVPDWMVALPNPSQNSKKQLKQRPIGRKEISRTLGAGALDDSEEGARKKGGGGGSGRGKQKEGGAGGKKKKQRIMSGVGSGFASADKASTAGIASKRGKDAGGGRKQQTGKADSGKEVRKPAAAGDRPTKKAKREVALDE
ncbi:hypothetical protein JCM3774_002932 [Rhodotorula dairenensis]